MKHITPLLFLFSIFIILSSSEIIYEIDHQVNETKVVYDSNSNSSFHLNFNHAWCAVKISSQYPISIDVIEYIVNGTIRDGKAIGSGIYLLVMNSSQLWCSMASMIFSGGKLGQIYYFHLGRGRFINYTYDNATYEQGIVKGRVFLLPDWLNLSAGTWYVIAMSGAFGIDNKKVEYNNNSLWINFSNKCKDLEISYTMGDKIFALWEADFDSIFDINIYGKRAIMLKGKKIFNIDNTFVGIIQPATGQGIERVKWIYPDNTVKKVFIIANDRKNKWWWFGDDILDVLTITGINAGKYCLEISYNMHRSYLFPHFPLAYGVHFIGADIKLPE